MQHLHGHAQLLNGILLLDPGTKDVRLHQLHQLFRLVLVQVVDDERPLLHIRHHAIILLELVARRRQGLELVGALARLETGGIGLDHQLLDVPAVGIHLDIRNDLTAFIIIAMAKLIAGRDGSHPHFLKQLLIMMGPRAADKQHRRLALGPGTDIGLHRQNIRHLFTNNLLHGSNELLITEVFGDLAQRLGCGIGTDEIHLDPGNPVFGLQHVGHIVDGAVAHDRVEVGLMSRGKLVIG